MTAPLDHDTFLHVTRCCEQQPHEDASSYEDSSILHRASTRLFLFAAAVLAILGIYTVADWRLDDSFNSSPRERAVANNAARI